MPISQIPLFYMLRTRMQWHQERQRLLAENVANADTPQFKARDLEPPALDRMQPGGLGLARTSGTHFAGPSGTADTQFQPDRRRGGFEVRPGGNAVNLEDEMLKVASNQMDFQAATALYTRGLGLLKTALGKRS